MLNLNLYDTTGDEDIYINQVLVDTGIATFVVDPDEQTGERLAHFSKVLFSYCSKCLFCSFFVTLPW